MPIRFRCSFCGRLLGIASRKAGATSRCPQCWNDIVVPLQSEDEGEETITGDPPPPRAPEPPAPRPAPAPPREPAYREFSPPPFPAPKPTVAARPKPKPAGGAEEALFIGDDIDDLLGMPKAKGKVDLEARLTGPKPVSGMDAMSLGDDAEGSIVLTPQRATLIVVAAVVLLGATFVAGVFIGMNTTRGG